MRIPVIFSAVILTAHASLAANWNDAVLAAVREMPPGGGFSATSQASARLRQAVDVEHDNLNVRPGLARPSYCSGATYLVLLKVVQRAQAEGTLRLDPTALATLPPAMQRDGQGVWGRWNANGPGTARLFEVLGLGRNFADWTDGQPGDFLKIFWRDAVGSNEHGHSVIYLGTEERGGVEYVRFWSSNQPGGYGEKTVPKSKIARVLFSRLEHPEKLAAADRLPPVDEYLSSLLQRESSFAEACRMSGVGP